MMEQLTGHLTEREIELYQRFQSDPAARQKTDAHLAACDACVVRVANAEGGALAYRTLTEAFLATGDEPFHLSHAELNSYVSGAAAEADRVICESHVEICERCSEELRQLTSVGPAPIAVTNQPIPGRKVARWWQGWGSFTPSRVVVASALAVMLVVAIMIWRRPGSAVDNSAQVVSPAAPGVGPIEQPAPKPADNVEVPTPPAVASVKDNGREIRLEQDGKLVGLEGFDESSLRMVKAALTGESLAKPKVLDELAAPGTTLMGDPSGELTFRLIGPLGRVVTDQRPTLTWQVLPGANGYVVAVFDGNFNRIAQSPMLTGTTWTPTGPLPRGRTYAWEVTAVKDGKELTAPAAPAPRAQFKVMEAAQLSTLEALKRHQPASHLALGLTYARFGLVGNAESEFLLLVKENPDSATAKKLLRMVQAWQ